MAYVDAAFDIFSRLPLRSGSERLITSAPYGAFLVGGCWIPTKNFFGAEAGYSSTESVWLI